MYAGRVGRPRNNLYNVIVNDLKSRDLTLETLDDLNHLKIIASDRTTWSKLFSV